MVRKLIAAAALIALLSCLTAAAEPSGATNSTAAGLRIATFMVDATPPNGSKMAYDPVTNYWDLRLTARGIVLLGAGDPIVLCAVDWIGIANGGQDAFREALATAAKTTPQRVAVHCLHQHDAPDCDFSAERILADAGLETQQFDSRFQRKVLADLQAAVRDAAAHAQPLTQFGLGEAKVDQVASNRRILGEDGKVRETRWTATVDPKVRAEPEGVIDPMVSLVSFWNGERPVAVLSYYATHPQSYYRTGTPNPDFPGVARFLRQLAVPAALHIHFTGAGGNIGAGKYNDGSKENREVLAGRLADGLRRAWENTRRHPLSPSDVRWSVEPVALPPAKHLSEEQLAVQLTDRNQASEASTAAARLAWLRRCRAGNKIDLTCLTLGPARILHLPGESFVGYQLAAKALRPDLFVAVAAYGDYAPWYIGTAIAYTQGGYETSPAASNVAPEVEGVLMTAIRKLLEKPL